MPEDAGSIYSEVRILIDKLKGDVSQAVQVMERFGTTVVNMSNVASNLFSNNYASSLRKVEGYIKSLDTAVAQGAMTQKQAIAATLAARKEEMAYIQATAAKKGSYTDQEIADLKRVTAEIDKLTEAQGKQGESTDKLKIKYAALAASATAVVAMAFRSIITAATNYSAALAGVQAATNATASEMEQFEIIAASMATTLGVSSEKALGAIEALAKAGVSTADILNGALNGALMLASAGTLDVSQAAEIASATMTQFGLSGAEVGHVADLLAAGAGKAQGEVSDLSMALKQSGLVAAQTGISLEATVGTLASFASAGLLGSDAGTSFKAMLLRLNPASKEAADIMTKYNIQAYDAQGNFLGMEKYAQKLQDGLKDLTVEQRNSALATVFGTDAIRAANILYTQGQSGIKGWTDKVNDAGYAAKVSGTKLNSLAGDAAKLDAQLKTTSAGIGQSLDPVLRGVTQIATALVGAFGALPAPVQAATTAIVGITAATLAGAAAFAFFVAPIAAAAVPIIAVVAGITALTAGVVAGAGAMGAFGDQSQKTAVSVEQAAAKIKKAQENIKQFGIDISDSTYDVQVLNQKLKELSKFNGKILNFDIKNTKDAAKIFGQIGASVGITAEQVARLAVASDKTNDVVKSGAKAYLEATEKTTADAKAKADLTAITDELTKAVEYQNYLVASGAKTEQDGIKARIALYQSQIDKIEKKGEASGKTDTDEMKRLQDLIATENKRQSELDKQTDQKKKDLETYQKLQESYVNDGLTTEERITKAQADELQKRRLAQIAANDEQIKNTTETNLDLIDLDTLTTEQLIALNQKLAQEKADAQVQEIKNFEKTANTIVSLTQALINTLSAVFESYYSTQLDQLEANYTREQELIEYGGLTKKQYLEKAVEDAKASGDAETVAEAEKQLALYNLEVEYTKKKAELEYQASMASWALQVASATAQAAQATLAAWSSTAAIPIIGPGLAPGAAGIAAAIGALQVAAVVAAMPQPPKLATGGIVLPSGKDGQTVAVADQGGGEIMFGTGALGQPLMQAFADLVASKVGAVGGATVATVQIMLDSKVIGQATVNLINNGIVKVKGLA